MRQISQVLEGESEFTINGITKICRQGDIAIMKSNVANSGKAITDCKILDVYNSKRRLYVVYLFLQNKGVNKIITVNSSKRPKSIKNVAHHFAGLGKVL